MTAPLVVVGRARPKTTSTTSAAATATTSAGSIEKPKKETNPRQPQNPQNAAVKLKVVVRGLPPNLPEAVFKETTKEWINETAVDWYYYVPGKLHERANKPNVRSRAYAKFKSLDFLVTFHKAFNGHTFTDSKGRSSRAVIEFAPYQKVVKGKTKPDPRQGTVDTSPEYKEFLESLSQPTPSEQPVAATPEDEIKTTPLIEYLRTQKSARAEKERINKEKMRLAKVAALQAKANAQAEKLRAEKLAKATENLAVKAAETGKVAGRGGRGGRGGGKGKDVARAKIQAQQPKPAATANTDGSTIGSTSNPVSTQTASLVSPIVSQTESGSGSSAGGTGLRGGRGRGRGRPHGVYRPGGRGGRRGGAPSVVANEGNPSTSVAEG